MMLHTKFCIPKRCVSIMFDAYSWNITIMHHQFVNTKYIRSDRPTDQHNNNSPTMPRLQWKNGGAHLPYGCVVHNIPREVYGERERGSREGKRSDQRLDQYDRNGRKGV